MNESLPEKHSHISPVQPAAARRRFLRITSEQLLIALMLAIITSPIVELLPSAEFAETVILTLLFLSAVLSVCARRRTFVIAASLAIAAVTLRWIAQYAPGHIPHGLTSTMSMVTLGFVMLQLLRFVLASPSVNSETLCAAISVYLLMGMFWAFAYKTSALLLPTAFVYGAAGSPVCKMTGHIPFYFSFATLTTLGYGDIIPASSVTRMLAILESICGLFYMTILIARLVSIQTATMPRTRRRVK